MTILEILKQSGYRNPGYKDLDPAISALRGLSETTPAERLLLKGLEAQKRVSNSNHNLELLKFGSVINPQPPSKEIDDLWRDVIEEQKTADQELEAVELELTSFSIALLDLHNFKNQRQNP